MQNFLHLLSLAASASALALPVEKRADQSFTSTVSLGWQSHQFSEFDCLIPAQFDDLTTNVVVPQLFPVGIYNGLGWGGVVVLVRIPTISNTHPSLLIVITATD
jgi:hypothetical protein